MQKKVTIEDKYHIKHVPVGTPIAYRGEEASRVTAIASFVLGLKESEERDIRVGRITCGKPKDLYWTDGVIDLGESSNTKGIIDSFEKTGYRIESAIGQTPSAGSLHLKATIRALKMNICVPKRAKYSKNATYISVEWELYDPIRKKSLYVTTTKGSHDASDKPPVKQGTSASVSAALEAAATNLLSDQAFVEHLANVDLSAYAGTGDEEKFLNIACNGMGGSSFHDMAEDLKNSAVTVKTGSGHGSGVIVDNDGHVLTNAHVVGDEEEFTIILADGGKLQGKLSRKDDLRDVALIEVKNNGRMKSHVSVCSGQPGVGAEIFVIGTPLQLNFSHTVTKGVISAERKIDGLDYFQTDASINRGNSGGPVFNEKGELIALTVAGVFNRDGVNLNLNYLIPIDDALRKLNISRSQGAAWIRNTLKADAKEEDSRWGTVKSTLSGALLSVYNWMDEPLINSK